MTHSHMTRWIEDADARQTLQAAMFSGSWSTGDHHHFLHLGEAIAKVPSWHSLANFGSHALEYARHPLRSLHH